MEYHAPTEKRKFRKQIAQRKLKIISMEKVILSLLIGEKQEQKKNYFNPAIKKEMARILRELTQKGLQSGQGNSAACFPRAGVPTNSETGLYAESG